METAATQYSKVEVNEEDRERQDTGEESYMLDDRDLEQEFNEILQTQTQQLEEEEENQISNEMRISFNEQDGVFSNMAAKPTTAGKIYEELEPPSYHETVVDPAPDYFINCVDETGEVLIEGLRMGNFALFSITVFISMTFDILGFFLTTMLATSHAARLGSQAGLGLTLMRYGALLRDRAGMNTDPYNRGDTGFHDLDEEKSRRMWSATFILCMGVFVSIRALVEFIRLRRMKATIAATPLNYGV